MKYLKSLTLKMCVIAVALLLASPAVAVNSNGRGTKVKTVYQDTDPSAPNYLKNRRALVGPGCTVNSVGAGVSVASDLENLQNLCNDDLDDYATIPALVGATVVANPIISVKDNQHYYAGGTEAGFVICAKSDASILALDLAKFYKIQFLKDGETVGELQKISTGKSVTGLGLSLLTFPGSDQVNKLYMATAPGDFDEIKLVQCGVDANLGTAINIKYAFVGKAREYTITNNPDNGIAKYAQDYNRGNFTLDAKSTGLGAFTDSKVIDADLTNGFDLALLNVLNLVEVGARPLKVIANCKDKNEAFPKGTEVGFKYNTFSVVGLDAGGGIKFTFYNKDGKEIKDGSFLISSTVLGLGVVENKMVESTMKAPSDFSAVKFEIVGLNAKLAADQRLYYAFVRMAPDLATHHCPIEATASHNVCGCENEYQLLHSNKVNNITWSIVSQPADSKISLDTQTGMVTNIYVPGDYTFMATAADSCTETTTIHYAPYYNSAEHGVTLLVNNKNEADKYTLSDKKGGSLIQIFGDTENANAILTSDLTDFVSTKPGVKIANNTGIVGVKSVDGSNLAKNVAIDHAMKVGFVVSSTVTGLSAKALELYNIQLLKNGKKVYGDATTHWNGISAGLIGSEKTEKGRLSIDVPAGTDFDEIVLYSSGVLSANLDKLNVYYAYVSDETMENAANNALYGAEIVSVDNTDASIDLAKTNFASVATIGSGLTNISNLIDNDMNTYMTFPLGVDLNGAAVMVNVGKIVNKQQNNVTRAAAAEQNKQGQKIVLATNQLTLGLGVDLIKVLKVTTYLDDKQQEELTDWKVLGADVIGTGGKGYVSLVTTKPFNKLKIEQVNPVKAANTLQIGGIALTSNINEDGTSTDCPEEFLVLDEDEKLDDSRNLTKATMVFHRTFTTGKWNSLILPVNMNAEQVKAAFGKDTKLAKFDKYDENWIYFSPVEKSDANGNMLEANIPYIIYPTSQPDYVNRNYNVGSNKEKHIDGPVYTVTGIYYGGQPTEMKCEDTGSSTTGMTHYGSYVYRQEVPAKSYMLSKGDMVHTSKVHKVKSYRSWLEETTPSEKTLQLKVSDSDNSTTGIKVIEEAPQNANAVYNVNGMRMNSSNTDNLPKGVYIINNKKVVIK